MHTIGCEKCRGRGRMVEEGFDGRTAVACRECRGTGAIELTAEEAAILGAFAAGCRAALDATAAIADVARFLAAAPGPCPTCKGRGRRATGTAGFTVPGCPACDGTGHAHPANLIPFPAPASFPPAA
jgi:DnaJ-class molecular chaperone